jgi:hypothetical protein
VCAASVRFQLGPVDCPAYVPPAFDSERARAVGTPAPAAPAVAPVAAGRLPSTGAAPWWFPAGLVVALAALAGRGLRKVAA